MVLLTALLLAACASACLLAAAVAEARRRRAPTDDTVRPQRLVCRAVVAQLWHWHAARSQWWYMVLATAAKQRR
jgi:hypothetical protein